jgi:hypothetical protein
MNGFSSCPCVCCTVTAMYAKQASRIGPVALSNALTGSAIESYCSGADRLRGGRFSGGLLV